MGLAQKAGDIKFSLYGREDNPLVEGVTKFQYIGRTLEHMDNYWPEVPRNIVKVQEVWQRLEKLLIWEGSGIRVSSMLYRTVIQAVLLFGS